MVGANQKFLHGPDAPDNDSRVPGNLKLKLRWELYQPERCSEAVENSKSSPQSAGFADEPGSGSQDATGFSTGKIPGVHLAPLPGTRENHSHAVFLSRATVHVQ
jgi:hypothetical protein